MTVLVALVSACGPVKETSLSMKSVPVPILLHAQPQRPATTTPAPLPALPTDNPFTAPIVILPSRPGFGTGPGPVPLPQQVPITFEPGTGQAVPAAPAIAPGAPACADLSPFAVPAHPATATIATTAIQGSYAFRNSGDVNGVSPSPSVHTISDATRQDTANQQVLQFSDTEKIGTRTVKRTFRVVNAIASAVESGELDLVSIQDSAGPSVTFQPGLELLKTPADTGVSWQSAATGYSTAGAASYRISGSVTKRQLVNACGQAVDSWNVTATETITGPLDNITYSLDYNVATGYGGVIVREVRNVDSGVLNGAPFSEHLTSVISQANPS
ncbi:MAG: hypothetical protein NVS3B24_06590 [Candidatus Dormibacteria bacterium]